MSGFVMCCMSRSESGEHRCYVNGRRLAMAPVRKRPKRLAKKLLGRYGLKRFRFSL